jgi:BolA protein
VFSPKNAETHFKVVVVSPKFERINSPVYRHRMIHECLQKEFDDGLHALSIVAKSPSQWQKMMEESESGTVTIPPSPSCTGGDGTFQKSKE